MTGLQYVTPVTYQKGSFNGGPFGNRPRFLPMLDMNSPKNDPPLKMGTPRFVGRVHLASTDAMKLASDSLALAAITH